MFAILTLKRDAERARLLRDPITQHYVHGTHYWSQWPFSSMGSLLLRDRS